MTVLSAVVNRFAATAARVMDHDHLLLRRRPADAL
jgi:hypothetical protein